MKKRKKEIQISTECFSMALGFVLGFLLAFATCWITIIYIIKISLFV
jgi:hypoxanthine-guanine phosphoribosyltransferase